MTSSLRAAAVAAAVLALAAAGCKSNDSGTGSPGGGSSGTPAAGGSARTALDGLPVRALGPQTGYTRERFGPAWADTDHNHCDTRDDILRRDLTKDVVSGGCKVTSGLLADPYTGRQVRYTRGRSEVDIDHVVALSDAWRTGAAGWTAQRREALANDPLNLLAVDASTNRGKGDGDASTWLPRNAGFRCEYVSRQVAVKRTYGLWVTPAEKKAIADVLAGCPHQKLPTAPRPSTTASPYPNCAAARAAGAAPLHRGDPGYAPALDRDADGTACS